MVSLNSSLNVGLSGIRSAQVGLSVTGNNISNINTEGYSRQRVDQSILGNFNSQGLVIGMGSSVNFVEGLRDDMAEKAVTRYEATNSFFDQLSSELEDVESLVTESDGTGIGPSMSEFFSTLERATLRPTDIGVRQELLTQGSTIAREIRDTDGELAKRQSRLDAEVADVVNEVNEITQQIRDINRQISSMAKPAEDLIDERRQLINDLSQLVGVETHKLDNNQIQVNLAGSNDILVGREIRNELGVVPNSGNSNYYDVTITMGTTTTTVSPAIATGKMGALLQTRDTEIPELRRDLDKLAAGLIIQVNTLHQAGTDMTGNTNLRFFDPDNATVLGATAVGTVDPDRYAGVAGTIALSTDLLDATDPTRFDPTRIALSASGAVGDNGVALQLANLRGSTTVIDDNLDGDFTNDAAGTYEKFYGTVLGSLGIKVKTAQNDSTTQSSLLNQATLRRDSAAAVNLDEEAAQLTQYQRAFEANSRFLNVINQLTGEILSRLGS